MVTLWVFGVLTDQALASPGSKPGFSSKCRHCCALYSHPLAPHALAALDQYACVDIGAGDAKKRVAFARFVVLSGQRHGVWIRTLVRLGSTQP